MRNEITEIKRAISTICAKQSRSRSMVNRNSRTDAPVEKTLTSDTVDAALADEGIDFVVPSTNGISIRDDQAQVVAGLSAQLAQLEDQCSHLRRMLDMASQKSR